MANWSSAVRAVLAAVIVTAADMAVSAEGAALVSSFPAWGWPLTPARSWAAPAARGGNGYDYYGGGGGAGGAGVALSGAGSLTNTGAILGGAGGTGGYGETANGAGGANGAGVALSGAGSVVNGTSQSTAALISGGVAVYAAAGSAATVTNFGSLVGSSSVSVQFMSNADRLIAEAGSTFMGGVQGGGGTLELANGSGTISGLGAVATVSGAEGITLMGFGHYVIDAGASFTLTGTNTLAAYQQVANYGTLLGNLTLGSSTDHLVLGADSVSGTIAGGGGTVRLAGGHGNLSIGRHSGVVGSSTAHFYGFGTYVVGAGGSWRSFAPVVTSGKKVVCEGRLEVLGAIRNAGVIEAALGGQVILTGATISAGGTLEAAPASTLTLNKATVEGGSLVTTGTGRILLGAGGETLDGTFRAVSVQGRLSLVAGGAATLAGSIALAGELTMFKGSLLTIAAAGATLSGGGKIYLSNSATNLIVGQSASATLTNSGDRIFGAGNLGGGSLTLVNGASGVIASFGSAGLTVDTGGATIQNAGTIEADHAGLTVKSALGNTGKLEAVGATLTLTGAITGAGSAAILSGGAVVADSAFNENVAFIGGRGSLMLAQSQAYGATISGFSRTGGTSLDLRDIGFVSGSEPTFSGNASGGVLTVTDGTHTAKIHLIGDYLGSTFTASSDGHGGTIVVDPAAPPAEPSTPSFVAAMAEIGARGAAGSSPISSGWREQPSTLTAPRAQTA